MNATEIIEAISKRAAIGVQMDVYGSEPFEARTNELKIRIADELRNVRALIDCLQSHYNHRKALRKSEEI